MNFKEIQQDQRQARVTTSMRKLGTESMAVISGTIKGKTNAKIGSRISVRKRFMLDEEQSTFTGIWNLSMLTKPCDSLSLSSTFPSGKSKFGG